MVLGRRLYFSFCNTHSNLLESSLDSLFDHSELVPRLVPDHRLPSVMTTPFLSPMIRVLKSDDWGSSA